MMEQTATARQWPDSAGNKQKRKKTHRKLQIQTSIVRTTPSSCTLCKRLPSNRWRNIVDTIRDETDSLPQFQY